MHYGLDIGGTKMELAVFDAEFSCLERIRRETPINDYRIFLAGVVELVEMADTKYGAKGSLGIGLPGVISAQGLALSSNVPCLTGQPITADLASVLERPVALGNDCRCFAYSEARLGAGKGHSRVLGVIIGTGLGGGLCVDEERFAPNSQLAGEFGHMGLHAAVAARWQLPVLQCGCGLSGCAETIVSGNGLGRLYQHFGGHSGDTYQWLTAYRQGEDKAITTFRCFMDALGSVIAGQILVLDPDVIVLGGGLSAVDEIRTALPEAIQQHLFSHAPLAPVELAEGGPASGVRGAALLGAELCEEQGL
ncbi:ROK family protein [Bowmanella pacifica]|uniref:N-acetylglucosamine kinase n=1 Tax=Bowmanella pacifica TaxID=502051 RepID=A0A917YXZ8_9ALTE|nr:ROK family protein [Bowmanella pacifica]GGO69880.1 transcriptional regulator [Bowmanella pacifica]